MANNPRIRWVAGGTNDLDWQTVGRGVRNLLEQPGDESVTQFSHGGKAVTLVHDHYEVWEVRLNTVRYPGTDPVFATKIHQWAAFARRGGVWAFAFDLAQMAATTVATQTVAGTTANVHVASSTGFAVGDVVKLEHATDPGVWERGIVDAVPDGTHVQLERAVTQVFTVGSVLRHAEYWPTVVLTAPRDLRIDHPSAGSRRLDVAFRFRTVR